MPRCPARHSTRHPRGSDDRCGCTGRLALPRRGQAARLARALLRRRQHRGGRPGAGGLHPVGSQRTPHPRRGALRGIPAFDRHEPCPGPQPAWARLAAHRSPAHPGEPSAEERVTQERRLEVIRALRYLPTRQRDCVALRYYLDLSIPDIAATLGVSTNSVKTHLQRGLRSMGQKLGGRALEERLHDALHGATTARSRPTCLPWSSTASPTTAPAAGGPGAPSLPRRAVS